LLVTVVQDVLAWDVLAWDVPMWDVAATIRMVRAVGDLRWRVAKLTDAVLHNLVNVAASVAVALDVVASVAVGIIAGRCLLVAVEAVHQRCAITADTTDIMAT
jgi:hypothetical protein